MGLGATWRAWAIASRGQTYRAQGDYERALADFDQVIAIDPKNATILANRGETYRQQGDYERALTDFDEAVKAGTFPLIEESY